MPFPAAAVALALLATAAAPFDLPSLPRPDEGYAALWAWLRTVNSELSIPDPEFRWVFGGFSLPIVLLFEIIGIRKDWKLYPFLLPFWLIFGSIALGVVGGVAATAAHLVLFPVGRVWFMVRDRRRAPDAGAPAPGPPRPPATPPALRSAQEALRAALASIRTSARPAPGVPGQPPTPTWGAVVRALGAALNAAAGARTSDRAPVRPPPLAPGRPPPLTPARPTEATGAPPGKPDHAAFRPDLSRFRRRPPKG